MGVPALFLLSSLCFVYIVQAQQCSAPIGGPNMNLKDDYITQDTFEDGAVVYFKCNVGYESAGGSGKVTCTAGSWSPVLLKCEKKSCGAPPEVEFGQYGDTTAEFGDTVKYECRKGYNLVGNPVLRCEDQGWAGRPPTCEVIRCVTPDGVVNGTFTPLEENYEYNSVVKYDCNKDFVRNGSSELVCSEDGKFHPDPPTCVWVECEDPVITHAVYVRGSRPPHRYKASVTYSCENGYNLHGSSTITCTIDSQWSPALPSCIKTEVSTAPPSNTTTAAPSTTTTSSTTTTTTPTPTPTTTTTTTTTTGTTTATTATKTSPAGNGHCLSPRITALIVSATVLLQNSSW
ncbi:membrane cofactor protein-like isoform X3 [Cyprinodon tularosa]|uniref:membrane cofactor protein-like isoform X3 n=1 Tax=Cyprinodon tularosa TaxID=77115 RepID=UPI0018E27B12|nr:membrane cofactor protein-like isoform X3 [Cyprinodon tularosa]